MARRRFLVDRFHDNTAILRGDDARHMARVLRAEPGRRYEISDGSNLYLAEITAVGKEQVEFRLIEPLTAPPEPVHLTIFAALVKFDRFEWMIEKATELGAGAIVPVDAERSEKGLADAARKRIARWRRVAHESSQQSRRLGPPEIGEPQSLAAVLSAPADYRYLLDETPGAPALFSAVPNASQRRDSRAVAMLTGPEGGWTDGERAAAVAAGWRAVSLGPLILRAETAAIFAAGLLFHAWWAAQLE